MKKYSKFITPFAIFFAITYLIGVILEGTFNTYLWSNDAKIAACMIWIIGLFIIAMVTALPE